MKKKIYSKRIFWIGVFFLALSLAYMILLIMRFNDISNGKVIKDSIYTLFTMLIGFSSIKQSLSYKETRQAEKENDEREELINLKSSNASIKIIEIVCLVLMVSCIVLWYRTKAQGLLSMVVAFGLVFQISLILQMFTYIYYNKKG